MEHSIATPSRIIFISKWVEGELSLLRGRTVRYAMGASHSRRAIQ